MAVTVTTIAYVMASLLTYIQKKVDCNEVVFDPSLSYETSLAGVKVLRTYKEITKGQRFPLLAHNRSVLKLSDKLNQRSRTELLLDREEGKFDVTRYYGVLGQIDARFLYISKNISDIERFEIAFNTDFAKLKSIKIKYQDLGEFNYEIYWNDLEDITINIENLYYKTVGLSASVHGWFFLLSEDDIEKMPLILEIKEVIKTYYG